MPRLALLAVLATAGALVGCGGDSSSVEDFQGAERQVAQTVEDLQKAGRDDDAGRICRQILAPELVARLRARGRDCVSAIDGALDDADSFELDVKDIRVIGNRARARVESGGDEDQVETLELVRSSRGWRIASLGG